MIKRLMHILSFILLGIFSEISVSLADTPSSESSQDNTQKVIASGVGTDTEKAKNNAIRNAIERAVGVFVTSDVVMQNRQIIKDELLRYSGCFVKQVKVISQGVNDDGLTQVDIEAVVQSTKLQNKLTALNISTTQVSPSLGELVQRAVVEQKTKEESAHNAQELLGNVLGRLAKEGITAKITKTELGEVEEDKTTIKVTVQYAWNQEYLKELRKVLDQVATESKDFSVYASGNEYVKKFFVTDGSTTFCFTNKRLEVKNTAEICYIIGDHRWESLRYIHIKDSRLIISLLFSYRNKSGDILEVDHEKFSMAGGGSYISYHNLECSSIQDGLEVQILDKGCFVSAASKGTGIMFSINKDFSPSYYYNLSINTDTASSLSSVELAIEPVLK